MYTNSCCSVSCVYNVDPSSSLSQLNSLIKIFSWLPVFRVGSICSSSCFDFSLFNGFLFFVLQSLVMLFIRKVIYSFPTHHHSLKLFVFGHELTLYEPISVFHSVNCVSFRFVLTFLLCSFFSLAMFIILSLTYTTLQMRSALNNP